MSGILSGMTVKDSIMCNKISLTYRKNVTLGSHVINYRQRLKT